MPQEINQLSYIGGAALAIYIFKVAIDFVNRKKESAMLDHLAAQTDSLKQLTGLAADNNKAMGQLTTNIAIAMERQSGTTEIVKETADIVKQIKAELPQSCHYQKGRAV